MIKFYNINTNSRFNYGAAADVTTAAIAVSFPLVVVVLRAFMCARTRRIGQRWGHKKLKQQTAALFRTFQPITNHV